MCIERNMKILNQHLYVKRNTQFTLNRQQLIPAPAGICYLVIMVLCIFIAINFKKLNVLIKLCMETMSLDVTPLVTF